MNDEEDRNLILSYGPNKREEEAKNMGIQTSTDTGPSAEQ